MLHRKMVRDLLKNKGAYFACIVIIALGLLIFTAFSTMVEALQVSQQDFYENQNFADGFIQVKAIPRLEVKKLKEIEGIKEIQGRLVRDVMVFAPKGEQGVYLRLVSMELGERNPINKPFLNMGNPLIDKAMKIWVDNKFFEANNLNLNDEIEIIASSKKRRLSIVGVASSPEFVYALQTPLDFYPSPETFGIAFIPLSSIEKLFSNEKTYNDLVFTLEPDADFDKVKTLLEMKLKPFGLQSLISRDDQTSHLLLNEEIKGLVAMSKAMPIMFLSVSAIILYITLKRLTEQQRGQIGILKADGYTSREILSHYISYALLIGLVGGLTGVTSGSLLSYPFISLLKVFFNLPGLKGRFSLPLIILGIFQAVVFSLLAGWQGSKKVLALKPAEALRPPTPIGGRRIFLEKIRIIWNRLNVQGMMAVRNLSRNKGRSLFIFFGIMFSFAISGFTWSMNDMLQRLTLDQYEKVEVYDVKLGFANPLNEKKVHRELSGFSGVSRTEPMAEVPVTLKNQWKKKNAVVLGLSETSRLYNILDDDYNKIIPPKRGLLLSERLAKLLDAEVGTRLNVESPMKANGKAGVLEVVEITPQYAGTNAYMELGALQEFLGQKDLVTSCMLSVNKEGIAILRDKYMYADTINTIDERSQKLNKFKEMMASYGSMIYIYSLIGIIIGFAIIYNSSVITLSERSRELASMMVPGMTPREVLSVVTFEQWCVAIPAMLVGVPMSRAMMSGISSAMSTDVYTMPGKITLFALFMALVVTTISIWIAQKTAARKIRNLSLVEVLKSSD